MYINTVNYAGIHFGRSIATLRSESGRGVQIRSIKGAHSKRHMPDEKYKQVNGGFKKVEVVDTISRRRESMPMMMDDAFETVTDYVECKVPRQTFIKNYSQAMLPLYQRIEKGYNCQEYAESYKPEINALNKITDISQRYITNQVSGEQFDSDVESTLSEYSDTNIDRKKLFVI